MYAEFLEKFNEAFTTEDVFSTGNPRVDLNDMTLHASIHIVGSEVPVYHIKYSTTDKVYEISRSFGQDLTAFVTKEPSEIIERIKEDLTETSLGDLLKEVEILYTKLFI